MTPDPRFSAQQWEELQNAIMYAFLVVAYADGKLSRLESTMLIKCFESGRVAQSPEEELFANVMRSCENMKEHVLERSIRLLAQGRAPQQSLHDVTAILDKATTEEALNFKQNLVAMAYAIAKNAKWRPRLTPQDEHAVEEVALALGFTG